MSVSLEKVEIDPTDAELSEMDEIVTVYVDRSEFDQESVVWSTNGTYRNNSGDYAVYYRKRANVLLWDNKIALVRFAPNTPIVQVSRNHLIID